MSPDSDAPAILIIEDEPEILRDLEDGVRAEGYAVETATTGRDGLNCLHNGRPIVAVLLDVSVPDPDGLQVLREIRNSGHSMPVFMISGPAHSSIIVEVMRTGASDFLWKPVTAESLERVLRDVLPEASPETMQRGRTTVSTTDVYFGNSANIRSLKNIASLVGPSDASVLIHGETGAGKEVLARHLHSLSARSHKPFLKLNCAALPSELVESELFGYERGAFTGAYQRKPGMFEIADGGTLLLDEIGDMDFKLQAKLLQVLQDREFQRLGGKEIVRVDVRVIAATHNELERSIAAGKFRQDLYYRLNVVMLKVPALRERRDDILPLTHFLLKKHCGDPSAMPEITVQLKQALLDHDWPGNIRELENIVRKLVVLRNPEAIVRDLMMRPNHKTFQPDGGSNSGPATGPVAVPPILEEVTKAKLRAESEAILAALNTTHWNRKRAASVLRIDYKALLYKMKKLGIQAEPRPRGPLASNRADAETPDVVA